MHPALANQIHYRTQLCYGVLGSSPHTRVHDDFGTLVPGNGPARTHFIYDTLWAGTPDEHELHAAKWAVFEAEHREAEAKLQQAEARPHSTCTLIPGDAEALVQTAAELIVHREGDEPPGELLYRLNLRGEPGVYITRSDLLALMTGAAELLNLELQPRAEADEAVPA